MKTVSELLRIKDLDINIVKLKIDHPLSDTLQEDELREWFRQRYITFLKISSEVPFIDTFLLEINPNLNTFVLEAPVKDTLKLPNNITRFAYGNCFIGDGKIIINNELEYLAILPLKTLDLAKEDSAIDIDIPINDNKNKQKIVSHYIKLPPTTKIDKMVIYDTQENENKRVEAALTLQSLKHDVGEKQKERTIKDKPKFTICGTATLLELSSKYKRWHTIVSDETIKCIKSYVIPCVYINTEIKPNTITIPYKDKYKSLYYKLSNALETIFTIPLHKEKRILSFMSRDNSIRKINNRCILHLIKNSKSYSAKKSQDHRQQQEENHIIISGKNGERLIENLINKKLTLLVDGVDIYCGGSISFVGDINSETEEKSFCNPAMKEFDSLIEKKIVKKHASTISDKDDTETVKEGGGVSKITKEKDTKTIIKDDTETTRDFPIYTYKSKRYVRYNKYFLNIHLDKQKTYNKDLNYRISVITKDPVNGNRGPYRKDVTKEELEKGIIKMIIEPISPDFGILDVLEIRSLVYINGSMEKSDILNGATIKCKIMV